MQSYSLGVTRYGILSLQRLDRRPGPRQRLRLLGILGPSGSGKSSLARAGLVASIRNGELESSQNWPTVILRPGANPLESLGVALSDAYSVLADPTRLQDFVRILGLDQGTLGLTSRLILRGQGASSNLVVVVDQFEEVFTLCKNEDQRKAFIDNLAYAAGVIDGQTIIVVVMRADFYGKCAQYQTLATALAGNQILVGQMSPSELRNAIAEPAKLTGYRFEPGLIDKVIEDASREPSALPLLQHTLLELWEHRKGDLFTHDAYREMGGLAGALERRAEAIFGGLTVEEQNATRRCS